MILTGVLYSPSAESFHIVAGEEVSSEAPHTAQLVMFCSHELWESHEDYVTYIAPTAHAVYKLS